MKRTPWAAVVGFGLTGVANTMLGPLLPSFQARWNLPDGLAGLLFTALFAAAVCGSAAVRPLAARYGHFGLAARGMALTAVGVAGCSVASWPLILVCVAVFGCGLGLAIPAANLGVAGLEAGDSAHALLWLNLIWSGGAVLSPLLVAVLGSWFLPLLAASFVVIAVLVGRWAQTPQPAASEAKPSENMPHLATAAFLFLYVGTESALSGWVSSYAMRGAAARGLWAILPSVFWGAILVGRGAAPAVLRRMPARMFMPACLACAFGGAVLLLSAGGSLAMLAACVVMGFGLAPLFPVVVARYADRSGGTGASGLVFSAAGLGGAAIPPLVGLLSTVTGSLRAGLAGVLLFFPAMVWLQARTLPSGEAAREGLES